MIFSVSTIMAPVTSRRPSFHARPLAVLMWLRGGGGTCDVSVMSVSGAANAGVLLSTHRPSTALAGQEQKPIDC